VHAAIDSGVTLFDTADAYGPRLSESVLGQALKGVRDQVLIATKVGQVGWNTGEVLTYQSPEHIMNACDASLYRLGTDVIDIYQCHQPNPSCPEVFVEAFERLMAAGKIRAYGASTDDVDVLQAFDARGSAGVCQLGYSVLNRSAECELLPLCIERDIGTLARVPLERGILTGKFDRDTVFDDVNRSHWNETARTEFLRQLDSVEVLRKLTSAKRNMTQLSLAYLIAHPAITSVIPGMKTPEQARLNAAAGDMAMSKDELDLIRTVPEAGVVPLGASGKPACRSSS
jgi:aryl-alcohol dehydrogenase-like predicted oxidoreductase